MFISISECGLTEAQKFIKALTTGATIGKSGEVLVRKTNETIDPGWARIVALKALRCTVVRRVCCSH